MRAKYMILIDDRDVAIVKYDGDSNDKDDDDYWEHTILKGEQIWLPNHGLYEVQRLRYMCVDEPYLEVKVSFIKRNL